MHKKDLKKWQKIEDATMRCVGSQEEKKPQIEGLQTIDNVPLDDGSVGYVRLNTICPECSSKGIYISLEPFIADLNNQCAVLPLTCRECLHSFTIMVEVNVK